MKSLTSVRVKRSFSQREEYSAFSRQCDEVWKADSALTYVKCVADDVPYGELTSLPRAFQAGDDGVLVFSWITYESREQRDAVNAKVTADPRLDGLSDMPFDNKRMIFGGFQMLLNL